MHHVQGARPEHSADEYVPHFVLCSVLTPFSGAKLAFIVFRQQLLTVQGVLCATDEEGGISENMVRWAEKLPKETIVLVEGFVRDAQQEVISTEVHRFEMDVLKVCHLS